MVKSQPKNKVVTDVLNITETERKVLFLLNKDRDINYSIKELIEDVVRPNGKNFDRTTLQKIVLTLTKNNLIMKRQMNLHRGFLFVYTINKDIVDLKNYISILLSKKHKEDFKLLDEAFKDE